MRSHAARVPISFDGGMSSAGSQDSQAQVASQVKVGSFPSSGVEMINDGADYAVVLDSIGDRLIR